jgi:hypothetical protein
MYVDLFPQLYQAVKTAVATSHPSAVVSDDYSPVVASFPHVTMLRLSNDETAHTLNYQESEFKIGYEIQIYTTGGAKTTTASSILSAVDSVLAGTYRLRRSSARPVPNSADTRIYRYVAVYEGTYLSLTDTIIS